MGVGRATLRKPQLYVGPGTPNNADMVDGDLFVADELEVQGTSFINGNMVFAANKILSFGGQAAGDSRLETDSANDQLLLYIGENSGRHLVVCDSANGLGKDFDHATTANPTLFIHSVTNPDTDNTEYMSLAWQGIALGSSGTEDQDGHSLTIGAGDAGSGGTGNHKGGNIILSTGAEEGASSPGVINLAVNGSAAYGFIVPAGASSAALGIVGTEADGATAVGVYLGADVDLTNAGSKIVSFQDNMGAGPGAVEHAYVDYKGQLRLGSGITADANYILHAYTATSGGGFRLQNTGGNTNHVIQRDTAASADGDVIGGWYFNARDDGDNESTYAQILTEVQDPTNGSEEGITRHSVTEDGSATEYLRLDGTGTVQSCVASRMIQGAQGTDIASANDATFTHDGNYFDVTGAVQTNTLSATGIQAGTMIILQFDGAPTVKHATAGAGAQFQLAGAADFVATAGDTLMLVYDGTYWREVSRSVI